MFLYFITGCCVGSFLCLIAQRIPQGHSIIYPRSHCVNCNHLLSWYELIPLFSICFQRFRCRHCRCRFSLIYFMSEWICGNLFVLLFYFSHEINGIFIFWFFSAFLLSLMDCFYLVIESKTLYFMWFVLWLSWLITGMFQWFNFSVLLLVSFLLVRYASRFLGLGDVLVLLIWSGGLSITCFIHLLFIASLLGFLFFLLFLAKNKKETKLPFVPFLSVALLLLHLI
ncbi:MAG: prepilin peptidase [Enterococcus lacertideformus]|uniref:Prepilin peptidase n=1 Tax=Enterococcus lacertideformus TaxID=2771493 RepID=A0A931FBQ5_9ENTE|nr:prepilin peptidase [Enterococcus lacertideformus]